MLLNAVYYINGGRGEIPKLIKKATVNPGNFTVQNMTAIEGLCTGHLQGSTERIKVNADTRLIKYLIIFRAASTHFIFFRLSCLLTKIPIFPIQCWVG